MPIYEYSCKKCNNHYEERKGWNDNSNAKCPSCNTLNSKLFSMPAIVYKGSGFYTTDSRSNGSHTKTKTASNQNGQAKSQSEINKDKPKKGDNQKTENSTDKVSNSQQKSESKP